MKILLITTLLFSVNALGKVKKLKEKDFPKVKLSYGDTITIEQALKRNAKQNKQNKLPKKTKISAINLNLLCLRDTAKKRNPYSCNVVDLKTVSK